MWRSFSAFPQLFKNHIKKEEGRKPGYILGFQPKTMCKERNSSTMLIFFLVIGVSINR